MDNDKLNIENSIYDNNSRILIIDSVQKNINILSNILWYNNIIIEAASNVTEALKIINRKKLDLILLCINAQNKNNFEVYKKLKENPNTQDVPVILVSEEREPDDIVKGFASGASDYIAEPYNASELIARVNTQLQLKKSRDIILQKNQDQQALLHILCHDLINHFSGIDYTIYLSNRLNDIDEIKKILSQCKISVDNGFRVIDIVRTLRDIESGCFEIKSCNLKKSIDESYIILENKFKEKNINFTIEIDNSLNISAEKTSLINSVINNILINAIKFSYPESDITAIAEKENDKIKLTIKDSGIGMPDKILKNIFNIKKESVRNGTSGELGTGFGMLLLKKFIDKYKASIEVTSVDEEKDPDNRGTEITIYFNPA